MHIYYYLCTLSRVSHRNLFCSDVRIELLLIVSVRVQASMCHAWPQTGDKSNLIMWRKVQYPRCSSTQEWLSFHLRMSLEVCFKWAAIFSFACPAKPFPASYCSQHNQSTFPDEWVRSDSKLVCSSVFCELHTPEANAFSGFSTFPSLPAGLVSSSSRTSSLEFLSTQ